MLPRRTMSCGALNRGRGMRNDNPVRDLGRAELCGDERFSEAVSRWSPGWASLESPPPWQGDQARSGGKSAVLMNPSGGFKDDSEGEEKACGQEKMISVNLGVQKEIQPGHAQIPIVSATGSMSGLESE